ncbi:MAG: hypothetical protein M3R35_04165, partial [Candidatus Eremiobacteraeota bacterium]|nr:hypothetical protein [Candidatus Eremiobacteraeota bacterium]
MSYNSGHLSRHNKALLYPTVVAVWIVSAIVVAICEVVPGLRARNDIQRMEKAELAHQNAVEEARTLSSAPLVSVTVSGFVPKANEVAYLVEPVKAYQIKSTNKRTGGYGGVSMRVPGTHGMRINTGRFSSQSVPGQEVRLIADGVVIVTNRRVLVHSNQGNHAWTLGDISTFTPYIDGVMLGTDTGVPSTLIT